MIITMISLRDIICKNYNKFMEMNPDIGATEIAKAVGVHRSMVYKWKDGVNVPDPDNMEALAKLFGVDVMDFYKSDDGVSNIKPSRVLKKYLVIPDEVVELASKLDHDTDAWRDVITALETAIEDQELKKSKKA